MLLAEQTEFEVDLLVVVGNEVWSCFKNPGPGPIPRDTR